MVRKSGRYQWVRWVPKETRIKRPHSKASSQLKTHNSVRAIGFASLLVAGTLVLYSSVSTHDFINYDDEAYIVENQHVTAGLTWQTVRWSLTSIEHDNWHPLTWLSHALDCQLFGLDAGGHHITSVVIHTLNVLLLFMLLQQVTGAGGRSFMVAALFGWHPFNVQSVAWVAERKNVLSTLFFLLALGVYGWYVRHPGVKRMAAVAAMFALALASKPMAVTFPFVLLLLDYWPLHRVAGWTDVSPQFPIPQQSVSRLLLEKLFLFALSAASSGITLWAQKAGGAMQALQALSFRTRLENAMYSYVVYIGKMFWPFGFAVYYPHPGTSLSFWKPILAVVLLCGISIGVWKWRVPRPYLLVGWLWFLGALFPVIGIVQVGNQAMADRYAYLPLIGLFVTVIWSAADWFDLYRMSTVPRWGSGFIMLGILSFLTAQQLRYWENGTTIWAQSLQVAGENLVTEQGMASALVAAGDTAQAIPYLVKMAKLAPSSIATHLNLGACYLDQGRMQDATQEFDTVVKLTDQEALSLRDRGFRSSAFFNLGSVYMLSKDYPRALASFQQADEVDPSRVDRSIESSLDSASSEDVYLERGLLLLARHRHSEAKSILEEASRVNPGYANIRVLLQYLKFLGD